MEGFIGTVILQRDGALLWNGWTAVPKRWLQSQPEGICLLDVVLAYRQETEDFHDWFRSARERIHWKDYREAELLRRAVLARRGMERLPELWSLLKDGTTAKTVREVIGDLLTREEALLLCKHEHDMKHWLPLALDYAQATCFIPDDLRTALLNTFAPEK